MQSITQLEKIKRLFLPCECEVTEYNSEYSIKVFGGNIASFVDISFPILETFVNFETKTLTIVCKKQVIVEAANKNDTKS